MKLTCLVCPVSCELEVSGKNETDFNVTGNRCPRGIVFARDELLSPKRVVTLSVPFFGGKRLALKTSAAVPKDKIFEVINEMKKAAPSANASVGDVLIEKVLGLSSNIVVTGILED